MGLTFDAPISLTATAYDKANRRQSTIYALPVSRVERTPSLLEKLKVKTRKPFRKSGGSSSSHAVRTAKSISPKPATESQLFRLPLAVRQKIYGYLVGQNELLHILLRYRSAPSRCEVAYRRCGAGGDVQNCAVRSCREFHNVLKGTFYGYFNHVGGVFLTCRDM
jgi:hypothetical protein